MKRFFIVLIVMTTLLITGCSKSVQNDNDLKISPTANYMPKFIYPDGLPNNAQTISISDAIYALEQEIEMEENTFLTCESVEFINERAFYIIRKIEDYPDRMVTVGWYAVDVFSSKVFDTMGLMDLIEIE